MVISIEIPTSIAMPITTAASTESLCNKLIFSYAKFRQRCHKRRDVTTSRNIEQDLRVHTLASQSGAHSVPSVLAAMKSDPGPPDEAPQCGKSRASAGDRSTASVHSPSSPIYLSPSHRRLFAIACLNSIRTAAGERQDVVLDVPGHAPLVRPVAGHGCVSWNSRFDQGRSVLSGGGGQWCNAADNERGANQQSEWHSDADRYTRIVNIGIRQGG